MKKNMFIVFTVLMFSLCACSALPPDAVPGNTEMPPDAVPGNTEMPPAAVPGNTEMPPAAAPSSAEIFPDAGSANIETLKGWSFQYNQKTNDYSLLFGLLDGGDEEVSANVDVDIRIVNDSGEEVYSATNSVTGNDFGYYKSAAANRIPLFLSTGQAENLRGQE